MFESPELNVLCGEAGEVLVGGEEQVVFAFGALVDGVGVVAENAVQHLVSAGGIGFNVYDVAEK